MHSRKENDFLVSQNVRFFLWQDQPDSLEWSRLLKQRLKRNWPDERILHLLKGKIPTDDEIADLAEAFSVMEDVLRNADFLGDSGKDVLSENLKYLLSSLEHGGKVKMAEYLGKDKNTISRWQNGATRPKALSDLRGMVIYFGLPKDTDLKTVPLFLAYEPLSATARRHWLREQIGQMSDSDLQAFFPALKRILE